MSRPGSISSNRSGSKNGYRIVSKDSYVDESLFGNTKPGSNTGGRSKVEIIDKAGGKTVSLYKTGAVASTESTVTLKKADLERMIKASPILSADQIATLKHDSEAKRDAERAVSKARKEKMLRMEEEAKKNKPPTETELLQQGEDNATLKRAKELLQEGKDDVKHMNQMMLYAKCVTIRDAQIDEKKHMMLEDEEEQRRLDLMMEVERIKALQQYEEREVQRREERLRGASVLAQQIEERERERIRQEELRDQERLQLMKELERLKEVETQQQIERKLAGKAMMEEVAAANSEQVARKEVMKGRERDEDARIAQYIVQKEIREQAVLSEKERIAKEKEMETARLRAQQERAADKQAGLDELRARRYQEQKEREWRSKERAMGERQAAMEKELSAAREAQRNAKLKQKADMARVEQEEFWRVLDASRAKEQEELAQALTSQTLSDKYKQELQAQIKANEERRRLERQQYLEEGERLRQGAERERLRLLQIKEQKLQELHESGVPDKYCAELSRARLNSR